LNLCVAKLGGSLADRPDCGAWLAAFAASRHPLIVVPGGGYFARGVRVAQIETSFDDAVAHRLALLAMERFGAVLAGHSERFALASSHREIEAAIGAGKIPVWLPLAMALAAPDIPASWDMTSDSLAAWLARACGAKRLLLVKSCDVAPPVSLRALADGKIVDPLFARFASLSGASITVAGPAALPCVREILQEGGVPGASVALAEIDAKIPAAA
jgi:dihydroneopterin aldolase